MVLEISINIVLVISSILLIYKSSNWVIRYSVSLSKILGISTFVVGFIILSLATSLPELFVTIVASFSGNVNLAAGNILGSNLFNINVIIGLTTIFIGTIIIRRKETLQLIELLFITSVVTVIILTLPKLLPIHGLLLLILYGYVIRKLYKGGRIGEEIYDEKKIERSKRDYYKKISWVAIQFVLSIVVLLVASSVLVGSSVFLAEILGLSAVFIGATVVAFGTSVPELAVTFAAVRQKHYALAMGDLIGSAMTNITLVLGVLALLGPFSAGAFELSEIGWILPYLIISPLLLWITLSNKRRITSYEGTILLLMYAIFILHNLGVLAFIDIL